jgi:hypothetical protein
MRLNQHINKVGKVLLKLSDGLGFANEPQPLGELRANDNRDGVIIAGDRSRIGRVGIRNVFPIGCRIRSHGGCAEQQEED